MKTRFAPSPTGNLHIGGARTALFNYLYAKAKGGEFHLRIEDTDTERSQEVFTQDILASLKWLGIDWDAPPIFQSQRTAHYREIIDSMLQKGLAYKCDATEEDLAAYRDQCRAKKIPYRYPGWSRDKDQNSIKEPYVIRIKNPLTGFTAFKDLIRGKISIPNKDIEDWIICRSNGMPTYNFVVTVDDHEQEITHVLRGEDHINNTPKQILLYQAMGWTPPEFAHLPMILGKDKSKLSKRHGAASTLEYKAMGFLPETMINFLVRMGWSHGDQEIFSIEELKTIFDIQNVGRANAMFDTDKLLWWSGHYLREKDANAFFQYLQDNFEEKMNAYIESHGVELVKQAVSLLKNKVKTILELFEQFETMLGQDPQYDLDSLKAKQLKSFQECMPLVAPLLPSLTYHQPDLEKQVGEGLEKLGLGFGKFGPLIRFAVTGGKPSPEFYDMLEIMGKQRVVRRVDQLAKLLNQKEVC